MSQQWGIYSEDSADYSEMEAVEIGFYSREEAEQAILERYSPDDDLFAHLVEEEDEDEWEDEDEE